MTVITVAYLFSYAIMTVAIGVLLVALSRHDENFRKAAALKTNLPLLGFMAVIFLILSGLTVAGG